MSGGDERDSPLFNVTVPALSRMVMAALSVMPEDVSAPGSAGVLLHVADSKLTLAATDGVRLLHLETTTPAIMTARRFVVPWESLAAIQKALPAEDLVAIVQIAKNESELHFQVGDRHLHAVATVDSFPDYDRILHENRPLAASMNRRSLQTVMEHISLCSEGLAMAVRIRLDAGGMTVSAPLVRVTETVAADYGGPAVQICLNSSYLLGALRVLDSDRVVLRCRDSMSAVEFESVGIEDSVRCRFVIMPLRV